MSSVINSINILGCHIKMGNALSQNPYCEELKTIWAERIREIEDEEVRNLLNAYPEENFLMANKTSVEITRIVISKTVKFSDLDPFLRMNLFSEPAMLLFKLDDPTFLEFLRNDLKSGDEKEDNANMEPNPSLSPYQEQVRKLLMKWAQTNSVVPDGMIE